MNHHQVQEEEKKICRRLITPSIKLEIRHFHVIVML